MNIKLNKDRLFDSKKMAMIDYTIDVNCQITNGYLSISKKTCEHLINQLEDNLLVLRDIHSELEDF